MSIPKSFIPDKPAGIDPLRGVPSSFVPTKEKKLDADKISQLKPSKGFGGFKGFIAGAAKGALETGFEVTGLAAGIGRGILGGVEKVTGLPVKPEETFFEKEKPEFLEARTGAEKAGKFVEQVAEFAVPLTKVAKVTKGANFLIRLGSRILTSAGVATAQVGEVGKETVIAGGVEAALPVAGKVAKPVFNVVRRLFKGLGSALSGVGTNVIDTIIENPQKAAEISRQIEKSGNFSVLETNARVIVEGVSKVRQEARKAFGEGLEKLKLEDVSPDTFRKSVQGFLDSVGSVVKGKFRELKNVEFESPKLIQKASNLIEELSTIKLDGLSLRRLLDKVGNARFKTTGTDPERLAFNAFIKDFEKAIKTAINDSTDKLKEINKAFSTDIQLTEGIERIFGKIKFKSLKEIDTVAQKLESLFSQKGLNPRDIDRFLNRIGIKPEEFRTTEAVRQISERASVGLNRVGLTFAEMTQLITSAVITPETVKTLSIVVGRSEPVIKLMFEGLSPTARGALLELLIKE